MDFPKELSEKGLSIGSKKKIEIGKTSFYCSLEEVHSTCPGCILCSYNEPFFWIEDHEDSETRFIFCPNCDGFIRGVPL